MLIILIISVNILNSGPIHNSMDNRIKGQSYLGEKSDYQASKDGLGVISLQDHKGVMKINNEIKIQKILIKLRNEAKDISYLINIKESLNKGLLGNINDLNNIKRLEDKEDTNDYVLESVKFNSKENVDIGDFKDGYKLILKGVSIKDDYEITFIEDGPNVFNFHRKSDKLYFYTNIELEEDKKETILENERFDIEFNIENKDSWTFSINENEYKGFFPISYEKVYLNNTSLYTIEEIYFTK